VVTAVFEVEQDASGLNEALGLITRNVWISIGIGLVAIGLVMAVGIAARTREVNRRRRQAEGLLESSFTAQEVERRRVVSALHDDIGQPMYRLLYGIEGSRAKLDPADPVAVELDHLADVVRQMDDTLRNELRLLHFELAADAGLVTALEELADLTRIESDLDVVLSIDLSYEPPAVYRTEIYRAAREAITNVRKHADASGIEIRLIAERSRLTLEITDDGTGTDSLANPGLGLSTTRQRFRALGGDVTLERTPSGETRFRAWLPRMKEEST
jgi:signal transduction histidine kinase